MRTLSFWIAVLLVIAALRAAAYLEPDPSDAYRYAYVGAKWVDGELPYRDLFENKPPAIYAINALAFAISRPHHWWVLYGFEVLLTLTAAIALAGMVRRWLGGRHGNIVAVIAVTLACGQRFAYSGNMTELFQVAWIVMGLWVITVAGLGRSAVWYGVAGCLIGLGGLFKPPGLAAGIAIVIWLLTEWLSGRLRLIQSMARVVFVAAGALVPWVVAVGWFAMYGLAGEMLYASLAYNRHYGQEMWQSQGPVWVILRTYQELWPALPILAVGGYVCLTLLRPSSLVARDPASPNWRWLAVLWMLGDLGGALAGGRCYQHYFVPLMFSATAVAGFALLDASRSMIKLAQLAEVAGVSDTGGVTPARRVGLSVLILWVILLSGRDVIWGMSILRSGGHSSEGQGRIELVEAAKGLIKPGDRLFTWGSAAYFFYGTWLDPIYPDMDTHRAYDFDDKAAQIGRDVQVALRTRPPRFIITDVNEDHPQRQQPDLLRAFDEFKAMVKADYRAVMRRGPRTLYVRKETPAASRSTTASTSTSSSKQASRPTTTRSAR